MTHLSDEFLLAYIDGQLERGQAAGVSELAAANAEVSRRLAKLKRTQAQLIETFGSFTRENIALPASFFGPDNREKKQSSGLKAEARPVQNPRQIETAKPRGRFLFAVAVFIGGLAGGYGATLLLGKPPLPAAVKISDRPPVPVTAAAVWASDLARFHAFFPKETLTPHPDAISNIELIRFQLTKVAAKALTPPDFSRQGYTLFRGQVFNYNQERMMQLTYSAKTEPPLTLYIGPATASADAPITIHSLGSNKAASWVLDRVRFFLTSDKDGEDLKVLAVIAQSQMPKQAP